MALSSCGVTTRRVAEESLVESLKRDVNKVRFAIQTTKTLQARARGAKYAADLYYRLAELYVEEARYHYQIAAATQKDKSEGVVSVQSRLLKNQAIATYRRLMSLYPDYARADRVYFYIGHEQRELGDYEEMLKTYQELADRFPTSDYRLEGLLVMGDYWFDKADLDQAEKFYLMINSAPETRVHAMARYKLGWCKINRSDFKGALKFFEGAISAARRFLNDKGGKFSADSRIDLRREALVDAVYCYTEVYKPTGALSYFRDRADSKVTYIAALDKLGNRYYVKQNWVATAMVYRELLALIGDTEDTVEYAHRLYESVVNGKIFDRVARDVEALIRIVRRRYYSNQLTIKDRQAVYETFEKYTRDLATRLHDQANRDKDDALYQDASAAYSSYLGFYSRHKQAPLVRANLAEVQYASRQYLSAARNYEQSAYVLKGSDQRDAIHTAVVAYYEALSGKHPISRLDVVQGRAGLRRSGRWFIRQYGTDGNIVQVKFNVARSYYDAGELDEAIRLFSALVDQYPTSKEAPVSAHLILDAYRTDERYEELIDAGKAFAQRRDVGDDQFRADMVAIVKGAEEALLRHETLKVGDDKGDGTEQLEHIASKFGGSLGEKALLNAFVAAKATNDPDKVLTLGDKYLQAYPNSENTSDVLSTMAKIALDSLQFYRGVDYLEAAARRKKGEGAAALYIAAATLRTQLGDAKNAEQNLSTLLRGGGQQNSEEVRRLTVQIARLYLKNRDYVALARLLQRAGAPQQGTAEMAYLAGYAHLQQNQLAEAAQAFSQAQRVADVGDGTDAEKDASKEASGAAQYYLAELSYAGFEKMKLSSDLNLLGQQLKDKLAQLNTAREQYRQVVQSGSAFWGVAALGRLAAANAKAAASLRDYQLPAGLSEDAVQQVRQALVQQAAPLDDEAKEALSQCAAMARKFKLLSSSAKACLAGVAPVDDPQTDERASERVQRVQLPPEAAKLQKSLASRPKDIGTMLQLARLYLRAGDPFLARVILGKCLELSETAEVFNLIAVATARIGELQSAMTFVSNALDADTHYVAAQVNRAYLLKSYGYKKEADAALSRVSTKQLSALPASDRDAMLIPGASELLGGAR